MSALNDAESRVSLGDFSQIRDLSDLQLVNLIEENEAEIQKTNRHRRLKCENRRIQTSFSDSIRKACYSELFRRIRHQAIKEFLDRLKKRKDANWFK